MKRKAVFIILVLTLLAGNLSAQDTEEKAKNIIGFSVGLIGADLSYERVLFPNLSVLGQVSYTNWAIADSLSISGKVRWYPFSGAFFLDAGLGISSGYNFTGEAADFIADIFMGMITFGFWFLSEPYLDKNYSFKRENGFLIQPGLGWNFDIGKKNHFMMPVSAGLDIRLSENKTILPYLRIGLSYAF